MTEVDVVALQLITAARLATSATAVGPAAASAADGGSAGGANGATGVVGRLGCCMLALLAAAVEWVLILLKSMLSASNYWTSCFKCYSY